MSTTGTGVAPDVRGVLQSQAAVTPEESRQRWMELGLVLLIFIAPLWIISFSTFLRGGALEDRNTTHFLAACVHEFAALLLLGYVLKRSGRNFGALGIRPSFGGLGMGAVLWLGVVIVTRLSYYFLQYAHFAIFHQYLRPWDMSGIMGGTAIWVWVPFILLNPWFEEVLVRGYVMTEVAELSGSTAFAVLVSTAIQTGYHLYQGPVNTVMVGSCFLLLSLYYARTRKLFPVIVAHTIIDVLAGIHLIYHGRH